MYDDVKQDALDELEFMKAVYPEPEWTDEEIERFEQSMRKESINGRTENE